MCVSNERSESLFTPQRSLQRRMLQKNESSNIHCGMEPILLVKTSPSLKCEPGIYKAMLFYIAPFGQSAIR